MSDGHSGIENNQVNEGGSGNFGFVLSYLKEGSGQTAFVLHATSKSYLYRETLRFLSDIGLSHFEGHCSFHDEKCFYSIVAEARRDAYGDVDEQQVENIHEAFSRFAGNIDGIFQLRKKLKESIKSIGLNLEGHILFGSPVELRVSKSDIPSWVNEVKFPRHQELEKQRSILDKEINELNRFLPLLYGTGDVLENAVIQGLCFIGLKAERTAPGFTADILAETTDGLKKFGFEVTGIAGPVKKDSIKLTQLSEFERVKEYNEKAVLIANTYNTKPINERKNLEDFTPQVISYFSAYPILIMTGWDLYCMVRDVLEEARTKEEMIDILYSTNGKLGYPA